MKAEPIKNDDYILIKTSCLQISSASADKKSSDTVYRPIPNSKENYQVTRGKKTSDGISYLDWHKVHLLAVEIANATIAGNTSSEERGKAKIIDYLQSLKQKYGCRASILATIADYTAEEKSKIELFEQAFKIAQETADFPNKTYIAHSLADLYVREMHKADEARKWVEILSECLYDYSEPFEEDEYSSFVSELESMTN